MRIYEFWPVLDDHGMFQSIRVMKRIHLHLFDVRKVSVRWEGRVRDGDDIYFRCSLSMCLLYRSPFVMYFALSKVSRLSMVITLLIVTSAAFFLEPPIFTRVGEKSQNTVKSRTQKPRG